MPTLTSPLPVGSSRTEAAHQRSSYRHRKRTPCLRSSGWASLVGGGFHVGSRGPYRTMGTMCLPAEEVLSVEVSPGMDPATAETGWLAAPPLVGTAGCD
eukprot:409744-Amphidinium_carterae.1